MLEGSRFDTSFRDEINNVSRSNHPSFPCLNASAGFSSGEWFEVGNDPVEINILFGEMSNAHTYGLLLIERENEEYEETIWGQPKWPVFLTSPATDHHQSELIRLQDYLEGKLKGAFSTSNEAVWNHVPRN